MKKLMLVLLFLVPATLFAQSAFDGTWRVDPQSAQFEGKPYTVSLQNGVFRCNCVPEISTKADGKDHKRVGSPYTDTVNVREVNDHTIEWVTKKDGKIVRKTTDTASPDGNTLTSKWTFFFPNGQQSTGTDVWKRVAPAPEGANKVSGSWQLGKVESISENVMTTSFKVTENGLSMTDPIGDSYTAKFDGQDYPYKGNPGITSVSLKKIDGNTIEETDKRDGKVISVQQMTVLPDGKTMTINVDDKLSETTEHWTAQKQ